MIVKKLFYILLNFSLFMCCSDIKNYKMPIFTLKKNGLEKFFNRTKEEMINNENILMKKYPLLSYELHEIPFSVITYYNQKKAQPKIPLFDIIK